MASHLSTLQSVHVQGGAGLTVKDAATYTLETRLGMRLIGFVRTLTLARQNIHSLAANSHLSPKGWNSSAQGNALGEPRSKTSKALKGRNP